MAKLSAHGYEIARFEKTRFDDRNKDLGYTMDNTFVYSIRSDGHVLKKQIVVWNDGQRHDYGFKLWRKATKNQPINEIVQLFEKVASFRRIKT